MTRRLALITAWLLCGHACWLAVFWALLQVPESSTPMLALSALLAVTLILMAAILPAGAAAAWTDRRGAFPGLLGGARYIPAALLSAVVVGVFWWITGRFNDWHASYAGQMDAWLIAHTGRSNTRWIHVTAFWLSMFVRWSLGVTIATSLLHATVERGWTSLTSGEWVRSAIRPRRWLTVTFWLVLLIGIPWQLVDWRPRHLTLDVEPWFVAAKLGAIAVAMAMGYALILGVGHGLADLTPGDASRNLSGDAGGGEPVGLPR